jgi:hypothetical protein
MVAFQSVHHQVILPRRTFGTMRHEQAELRLKLKVEALQQRYRAVIIVILTITIYFWKTQHHGYA